MKKDNNIIYDNNNAYSGLKGKLIISIMNLLHYKVHKQFVRVMDVKNSDSILDVGCGGGNLIKQMSKTTDKKVCGIDYSKDMVLASKSNNKSEIQKGLVEIKQASVSNIPYETNTFDKLSVFETIQFWPDTINDLKETLRVLKPYGTLYIMNRMPSENSKWYDWCKLKTVKQYENTLLSAGFCKLHIDTKFKNGWIIIKAHKQ